MRVLEAVQLTCPAYSPARNIKEAARAIEPLCRLYCIPGLTRDEWGHAFKLLK